MPEVTTATAAKPRPRTDDLGDAIPVKLLCLNPEAQRTTILPGGAVGRIAAIDERGRDRVEIDYLPRIRHHRIAITPHDKARAPHVHMIPETWASWDPA
jgi:hypothetical protein